MFSFVLRNGFLLATLVAWYLVGSTSSLLFIGFATLNILLFWRRQMYFELLVGFFFILILSDNLYYFTDFAKSYKNIYILLLTAIAFFDRRSTPHANRILYYFLPFLAIAFFALAYSPSFFTSFQKTLSYALILYAVPQIFILSFQDRGPVIVKDIIYFGVAIIFLGFSMRYINPGLANSHGGRFRAIFGNPNGLGIFCILLFALTALARDYFASLFSKADVRWIFLPILAAIILSGSRTAAIGVTLLVVFTRFYRLSPFFGFVAFLGFGFAAEFLSSNLVAIVQNLGLSNFFRIETLEGGSGRFLAWNFAWEAIQDHLWFGRGFAFDEWLMDLNQDMLNDLGHQGGVHNTYLIIWLNTGLAGLFLFLRAFVLLFIKGAKNCRLAFPIFWMVLFSIMLEPWLAASLNPFTIMLLLAITLITDPIFQPYIRCEISSLEAMQKQPALA